MRANLSLTMDVRIVEALDDLAKQEGVTRSTWIRDSVTERLKRRKATAPSTPSPASAENEVQP